MKTIQKWLSVVLALFGFSYAASAQITNDPVAALTTGVVTGFEGSFGIALSIIGVMLVVGAIMAGFRARKKAGG